LPGPQARTCSARTGLRDSPIYSALIALLIASLAVSKKLHEKQQRRLAEQAKKARQKKEHRRANLITVGIAVAVAIAVVLAIVLEGGGPGANVGVAASEANCTERETFESEGNQHVDLGMPVEYKANPPTTGDHWPPEAIADAGFSEEPIDPERLVHNQEHGQLVIYYNPEANEEVLDQIEELVEQEGQATIGVPWDGIKEPYNYVLTAWDGESDEGVQMSCESPSQEVWNTWREDFQGRGPESVGIPTFSE
jgi:hypothetical protein